ncbi:hypothetical protein JXB27_02445 [Candidatus Woesearchaeota archaeon]|nr:hypothetical protein [Candidatus Woesearchaeota archaeon]
MKNKISTTLIFVLLLPIVFAQAATIEKISSSAVVSPLGEAKFEMKITNPNSFADTFMLELSDVLWSIRTENMPDFTTGVSLNSKESKTITVYLKPNSKLSSGTYYLELRAKSLETRAYQSEVFMVKIDPKVVDYKITIPVEILEPLSIDPAKTNSVKLRIKNPYPVYLEGITVSASSKFLNKDAVVDVEPESEKIIDFSLNIDESTPKQEDDVTITVTQLNREIASAKETIYIKEYRQPYRVDDKVTSKFLQTVHEITFTNTEGAEKTRDASFEKPRTRALILTSPLAKTEMFNNQAYLVWQDVTLKADETYKVVVKEDYRPLAGAAAIIIIIIAAYYFMRSPIIVKKKAYAVHKKDTGNNEIKVLVYIKNRTGDTIEKVRVLERLPIIHKVEPDFGAGTPEPKFRRGHEGIVLDWDIVLAPHEERIFTYKIKSALPIVGEHTLRPTVVQYGHANKRTSSEPYRIILE